jgi:4-carboxymuconolactone decarboxylase
MEPARVPHFLSRGARVLIGAIDRDLEDDSMTSQATPPSASRIREMHFPVLPDRMPRIPEDRMTPAQKEVAAEIASGPRGTLRGPFVPLLRSPELMRRVQKVGEYLRFEGTLEAHIKEFTSLVGARSWAQHYEWQAHYPLALQAGCKAAVLDALAEGRRPPGMREDEEVVYDFATELLVNRSVCDATYQRALAKLGEQGIIEVTVILGYYSLLAMVMNVARTPVPEGKALPLPAVPHQLGPARESL